MARIARKHYHRAHVSMSRGLPTLYCTCGVVLGRVKASESVDALFRAHVEEAEGEVTQNAA